MGDCRALCRMVNAVNASTIASAIDPALRLVLLLVLRYACLASSRLDYIPYYTALEPLHPLAQHNI